MDVEFAAESSGPDDVAQGDVEAGFDANVSPLFGDEFTDVDVESGGDVDGEFKTIAVLEFPVAVLIGVGIAGFVEETAGFAGVVCRVFSVGFFREVRTAARERKPGGFQEARLGWMLLGRGRS